MLRFGKSETTRSSLSTKADDKNHEHNGRLFKGYNNMRKNYAIKWITILALRSNSKTKKKRWTSWKDSAQFTISEARDASQKKTIIKERKTIQQQQIQFHHTEHDALNHVALLSQASIRYHVCSNTFAWFASIVSIFLIHAHPHYTHDSIFCSFTCT